MRESAVIGVNLWGDKLRGDHHSGDAHYAVHTLIVQNVVPLLFTKIVEYDARANDDASM
jgi:hypothetical protein